MITANPFGVGASGERREKVNGRCACCGLGYVYERWPGGDTGPNCGNCQQHAPAPGRGRDADVLARLREHEPRIRAYADYAIGRATSFEREAKKAKEDGRRQAASALRQRDLYRSLMADIYRLHADAQGQCKACKSRFPCAIVRLLEDAGAGVGDAILRLAARRDLDWDISTDR